MGNDNVSTLRNPAAPNVVRDVLTDVRLNPLQYRSVAIAGSVATAESAESRAGRAYSAGVEHANILRQWQ